MLNAINVFEAIKFTKNTEQSQHCTPTSFEEGDALVSGCFEGKMPWKDWFRKTVEPPELLVLRMGPPSMMIGEWVGRVGSPSGGKEAGGR